jgi:hypothetical protein
MAFPAILAAAIAGAGAIAGGVANLASAADANKTNREISEDTNATNMQINREQLAAQRAMYYTQARENRFLVDQAYERELENRSYNSPQNQKELYLRAGINPMLAGQFGSVGASHSMNVPTGQAPSSSTPNAIPAQSGEPVRPLDYTGLGMAPEAAINAYFRSQDAERADYALASDITFKHYDQQIKMMDSATKAKEAGVNEKWVDSQIADAERNYWLAVDKNSSEKEARDYNMKIEEHMANVAQYKAETERALAQSSIKMNDATIQKVANECAEIKERVIEMKKNGASQREIDKVIAEKERELKRQLARDNKMNEDSDKFAYWWKLGAGAVFEPLKGIFSFSGK